MPDKPKETATRKEAAATNPLPGVSPNAVANCPACEYGAGRSYGGHAGVDIVADPGQKVVASVEGTVACAETNWYSTPSGAGMIAIKADKEIGGFPAGTVYGHGHMYPNSLAVKEGDHVKVGQKIGNVGNLSGTDHLHFYINVPGQGEPVPCSNGNVNPEKWIREVMAGKEISSGSPTTTVGQEGVTGGVDLSAVESASKAAAFSAYLELPGIFNSFESLALKGQRSLMNDQPLMPFIEQLCQASLRRFQSMPNGNFYAFYPDYFGGMNHRTPYWQIEDIEILDGKMNLSDDALSTHVYIAGDTVGWLNGINYEDKAASAGVVTLFEAMAMNFITGLGPEKKAPSDEDALATKEQVISFLKRYGARPYYEEAPMVRSGYYEMFLAFQKFCLLWSKQFEAEFQLTYMPELFPGGLVALPEHGIQLFIEEVSHTFDYENGFTTTVMFTAPAALKGGPKGVHDGMIRSHALT